MSAAGGYITDVPYTASFNAHQAPAWLAYGAAINGYPAPRPDRPFAWCEIGCGKGLTALLLAAMHPDAEFYACDLNPEHIAYAERLRDAAGVRNLRLYRCGVGQIRERQLPRFDFITLHGVYSWVPDAVRGEIVAFARERLKPGGLLMVSYNAMPGWAHAQPIRQMMQAYAAAVPGNSLDKARAAFVHVRTLAENGAAYFRALPAAAEHLRDMARRDVHYIVHEYLTPHGDAFYFAGVEARMRAAGLAFAGSLPPADNYPELMVPREFHPLLATAPSRVVLETQRDFIANTSFRVDLYAAHPEVAAPPELPLEGFDGLAFCLTGLAEHLKLKNGEGALRYDLEDRSAAVRAVHRLLAAAPAHARRLHAATGFVREADTALLLQQLVVAGHLSPCPAQHPAPGWMSVNSVLVDTAIREQLTQVPLACPLSGTASQSEVVHAATIESAARFDDAETAARSVLARLRAHGHPVTRHAPDGTRRTASDQDVVEYVGAAWRGLRDASSPEGRRLRLFGVLA